MSIYHCSVKIIKRSMGRSAVAAAAYRAGEKLYNERDGITHDYTRKSGVAYCELMLPENAPEQFKDRSILWNTVEKAERRRDAQTAREVEIALPVEFDRQEQTEVVREYIQENFISQGMCADFAIHDKGDGNPHAHIMLTMRDIGPSGFTKKNRTWNDTERLERWRESWAYVCNERLQSKGLDERIDHRTLEAQGLEREPTIHVGRSIVKEMWNDRIIERNERYKPDAVAEYMNELSEGYNILNNHIKELQADNSVKNREALSIKYKAREIQQRSEQIQALHSNIQEAIKERDNMRIFQNKRDVNTRISMLENAYNQACTYFRNSYGIEPSNADYEIVRLKFDYDKLSRDLESIDLKPYNDELKTIEIEYQKQRLIAENRPDSNKIFELTERENTELSRITEDNYNRIIQEVRPSQARMMQDRRAKLEYERIKKLQRGFYERGR